MAETTTTEQLLTAYEEFGYKLVKIDPELKKPNYANWQLVTVPSVEMQEHAASGGNVGIQVGEVSDWICAVDHDCNEAVALAPKFLPDTLKSGKQGIPTHWVYRSPGARYLQFRDVNQTMLIELKASENGAGHQFVVEPSVHSQKGSYRWMPGFNPALIAEVPKDVLEKALRLLAVAVLIVRNFPTDGGHIYANSLCGYLLRNGMAFEDLDHILEVCWPASKVRRHNVAGALKDTAAKLKADQPVQGGRTLEELAPGLPKALAKALGWERADNREGRRSYRCTDTGNAERFAEHHGRDVLYCFPLKTWFVYDGKRWCKDDTGHVFRLAKETARSIFEEAAKAGGDEKAKELGKWAIVSQSATRIQAMLELAKSEPGIPVRPHELDADAFLFNCSNGTIDLRTGLLRKHRREDLISKLAPVAFEPSARSALFDRVIREATSENAQLALFLKRWFGYCLTGDTSEEKLAFAHGPAATAKSTLFEAAKATWGDYAATADFEAFLSRQHVGGPRNDIARLAGARLVVSIEVDEGKRLAEGLIKMLTGGDTVTARHLYQEAFEFTPAFKLNLAANHSPQVRDDDEAMWRRILRIPFANVIPKGKRDPNVKKTLKDLEVSGPAILAWAVEGCLQWQREGLGVPPVVEEATEEYREEMDPLRDFIADFCLLGDGLWVPSAQLREAYERWAKETGETNLLRGRKWGERLRAYGCEPAQASGGKLRIWKGIALKNGPEDDGPSNEDESVTDSVTLQTPCKGEENTGECDGFEPRFQNFSPNNPHEAKLPDNPSQSVTASQSEIDPLDAYFEALPEWLSTQLESSRGEERFIKPTCSAVAYEVLGDASRWEEVKPHIVRYLEAGSA